MSSVFWSTVVTDELLPTTDVAPMELPAPFCTTATGIDVVPGVGETTCALVCVTTGVLGVVTGDDVVAVVVPVAGAATTGWLTMAVDTVDGDPPTGGAALAVCPCMG